LLDAAGQVFAKSGFQAATVREICACAGVNIALVNYHFGDKLELYTEVLRHSVGASGNGIIKKAIGSTAPPEKAFRELIHAMLLRVCRADRPGWHFRLMMHEFAQPTPAPQRSPSFEHHETRSGAHERSTCSIRAAIPFLSWDQLG
jgi:TetR/AcrR family transcriptional regulator, regulator of cefoperazone and chloramphenicol sensitivity